MVAGKFVVSRKKRPAKTGCPEYTHYTPKGQTKPFGGFRSAARFGPARYSSTQALLAVSATGWLLKMKR